MAESEENPVRSGLIALVAVAVVVGLLVGLGAMFGSNVLGLGNGDGSSGDSGEVGEGESLFMPDYVPTERASGPLITLLPTGDEESSDEESDESESASESESTTEKKTRKKRKRPITLSQGSFEVSPGQELYLSGVYPNGEGVQLDIQVRSAGGEWSTFPVKTSVSNETFSTYVYTDQTGDLEWRVIDPDTGKTSNPVKVSHG